MTTPSAAALQPLLDAFVRACIGVFGERRVLAIVLHGSAADGLPSLGAGDGFDVALARSLFRMGLEFLIWAHRTARDAPREPATSHI